MAGHSKWSNIKHRKAAQDAKRGKIFTKLIREITVAARESGGEIEDNPRLRAVVDKALTANMTKDTIQRAIDRGVGNNDDANMEEITYEGYGIGGVAVLVETLTDNRNRTVGEVRHAFSKRGGSLGTDGSVAYLFNRVGLLTIAAGADEEAVMELALEAGADDIEMQDDGSIEITTPWEEFTAIKDALVAAGYELEGEVTMLASTQAEITDLETAQKVMALIDMLEDLDDVQNVYSNADFSDQVMEQLEA